MINIGMKYYVDSGSVEGIPKGSDDNPITIDEPLATIAEAIRRMEIKKMKQFMGANVVYFVVKDSLAWKVIMRSMGKLKPGQCVPVNHEEMESLSKDIIGFDVPGNTDN